MSLPKDIFYYPNFVSNHRELFIDLLEEFFSQSPEQLLFGGSKISGVSFRTDRPNSYTEATKLTRSQMRRNLWLPTTGMLAGQVGTTTGVMPSIAVINFYRDGNDFLEFHSDFDNTIGPHVEDVVIAAVSFGAERLFQMRRIDGSDEFGINLEPGSLFVMRGAVQRHWLHALPKMDDKGARLSITFLHHQLDPVDCRSWVLSKVPEGFFNAVEKEKAEIFRVYQGQLPTPVLIGTKEAVFSRWVEDPNWQELVVVEPSLIEHASPQGLLLKYPVLEKLLPENSNFRSSLDMSSPDPNDIPLQHLPTDFLVEMLGRVRGELQNRNNDPR